MTDEELVQFVADAKSGTANEKAFVATLCDEAAARIEAVCGAKMRYIMLESEGIRHSYRTASHNLRDDDVAQLAYVINEATDIRLSPKKHMNNRCLEFRIDKDGPITVVEEVRANYDGWLSLVTCYREKK
jgi:hypothetical protein